MYVFPVSLVMFYAIKSFAGLRVDENIERAGIDGFYHGVSSYPEFTPAAYGLPTKTNTGPEATSKPSASPAAGD